MADQPTVGLHRARPGVQGSKSLAKQLSPEGESALKRANALIKSGDDATAASVLRDLAARLDGEGFPDLATRAQLRAARALTRAGRAAETQAAVRDALSFAARVESRKLVLGPLRKSVKKLRDSGHAEVAEELAAGVRTTFGLERWPG